MLFSENDAASQGFSAETFALLAAIKRTPTAAFYLTHKAAFKTRVESPLQTAMREAAGLLPPLMRDRLETQRNIFSRFLKNDFGRGGAWTGYWGAFYPRGSRRLYDAQLSLWINAQGAGMSFFIGDYGAAARRRFTANCARYARQLVELLPDLVDDPEIQIARGGEMTLDGQGRLIPELRMGWEEWFSDPKRGGCWVFSVLPPERVLALLPGELARLAAQTLAAFFPLAILAMDDQPMDFLTSYIMVM